MINDENNKEKMKKIHEKVFFGIFNFQSCLEAGKEVIQIDGAVNVAVS